MTRTNCAVYGCLNSSIANPDLSFFKLPTNCERRSEWLRLICREDLMNKPPHSYTVCQIHFHSMDILSGKNRKKLNINSLPSLHLPAFLKKDAQTLTETPKMVEICIQTDQVKFSYSDSSQTARSLSMDSPGKRKQTSYVLECGKKIKTDKSEKYQRDQFHEFCDKYLTKELAVLIKAQTHLKHRSTGNRYDQNYIMFCLNLYYNSPQAYKLLQSMVCLPKPETLNKHRIPVTSKINDGLMSILKTKVDAMNKMEKNCSVVIDAMGLKTYLFYNLKQDKIIGFHEVDGVQSPAPARKALVVMVRGIFVNWKQPVGFALLSDSRNYDEIAKWIDRLLEKLFEIGLNIRTFVSDMGSDLFNITKHRFVTIERPYFSINERKIYYIFDAPHLIRLIHNYFITYDFHFRDRVAKYENIVKFYENDKQKSIKLAHKLTNSHIYPTNLEKRKIRYATELLSNSVAAGISTYVDFNQIEESGRSTAELIRNMNNLFDALNSLSHNDSNEYRKAFCGQESQITFFKEMLTFFQHVQLINPKNGRNITSSAQFINGFQITITSILMLFEDLKSEGQKFLSTRRLNKGVLENFFEQIRTKNGSVTAPTSRQFICGFQKIYFSSIKRYPKKGIYDLGKFLTRAISQLTDEMSHKESQETLGVCIEDLDNVQIMSSEYNQMNITQNNSLFYVCSYLLKKCSERHKICQILKSYVKPNQASPKFNSERRYSRYRKYSKDVNQSLLIVPPDDFVEYVKKLDDIFCSYFRREYINCELVESIYKEFNSIRFILPCPCFPTGYLKKLFIRMRIFYTIKFNNKGMRRNSRIHFTVNNLSFE
ncbi:unnamed protein product [Colias eurytheme]|nr:unnamed protein product [Colias eurytheme]